jgi:ABC-type transport system involved in multi-copper enzyme maturation permease subunit
MSSHLITDKQTDSTHREGASAGLAPSLVRDDDPGLARIVAFLGVLLIVCFGTVLFMGSLGRPNPWIGRGLATFLLALGVGCLLFHAAFDRDIQVRRVYAIFAGFGLLVGLFLSFGALFYSDYFLAMFLPGLVCTVLALMFALAFLRNETDPQWIAASQYAMGAVGAAAALVGLGVVFFNPGQLSWGLCIAILVGLPYLAFFVGNRGVGDDLGYRAGLAVGVIGLLFFGLALLRSFFPHWFDPRSTNYFLPNGLLLSVVSLGYVLVAVFLVSDSRLIVMIRRELGSFFFSPIAYIVLFGFVFFHGLAFFLFVTQLAGPGGRAGVPEPVVSIYLGQWWQIIFLIFLVPVLTMRLLSEERRTGTLEVLFTAPVSELQVVLSKFIAALMLFVLMWAPFFLYLIALRLGNENAETRRDFDYIPLLGFALSLIVSGAAFVSIGLFFSSLFRDQITSGVFTFVAMLFLTLVFIIRSMILGGDMSEGSEFWDTILRHISYIDFWFESLRGRILMRDVLFQLSTAVFFLFLTTKVLEARKWM